jgi:hypothetical protein
MMGRLASNIYNFLKEINLHIGLKTLEIILSVFTKRVVMGGGGC